MGLRGPRDDSRSPARTRTSSSTSRRDRDHARDHTRPSLHDPARGDPRRRDRAGGGLREDGATVDVASAGDSYAAPAVGSPVLRSASGPVRIVYAETTGETQALVVIGGGGNSDARRQSLLRLPASTMLRPIRDGYAAALSVDFGDMLCCDGRAGGVKTLRWNRSAWVSPTFWCQPDAGGSGDCGTAVFTWSDTGRNVRDECSNTWTRGPGSPNNCTNGSWAISVVFAVGLRAG